MGALSSLRPALGGIVRNPVLPAFVGLYGLFQLPQLLLQGQDPLVAAAVSLFASVLLLVFLPFFQGGLLGMADEALADRTSIGTLIAAGKSNYLTLLLAYLLLFGLNLAIGFFVFFGLVLGGVGLFAGGNEPGLAAIAVFGVFALVVVLAYLIAYFFIQFYAHAIVLSDADLVDGFKRSIHLVRQNLLATFGYTALVTVGGGFFGALGGVTSVLLSGEEMSIAQFGDPSPSVLVAAGVVYLLATAIMGAFYATYSVSFYRDLETAENIETAESG